MSISLSCALCGGVFKPLSSPSPPSETDWTSLARLVSGFKYSNLGGPPVVSGLGYVDPTRRIQVRMSYESSYIDHESAIDLEAHSILDASGDLRQFGFHEFCWQMLLIRLDTLEGRKTDPGEVGPWLFHYLQSLPWGRDGSLIPDNNYHGSINLRHNGNGRRLLRADPTRAIDPVAKEDASFVYGSMSTVSGVERQAVSLPNSFNSAHDPFTDLPSEIMHLIFILLPSKDICSARLSSRRLALFAHESNLPQSFWASRFFHDNDMGFALDPQLQINTRTGIDWHKSYLACKKHNLTRQEAQGLENRRRIWRCIGDIAIILNRLLHIPDHKRHHRSSCLAGVPSPSEAHSLGLEALQELGAQAACPRLPDIFSVKGKATLRTGVRLCELQLIPFQRNDDSDTLILQVCTTPLSSGVYISGLRVLVEPHESAPVVVQEAGLVVLSSLRSVRLDPGDKLTHIDVTLSSSGLHGLRFVLASGDGGVLETTVGDMDMSDSSMALIRLKCHTGISGLFIGFDVWKAGFIQIITPASAKSSGIIRNQLWSPMAPPLNEELINSAPRLNVRPPEREFSIGIYMPFGGHHGSLLSSLCQVTAFLHGTNGFFGLQFTYVDGTKSLYGRAKAVQDIGNTINCVEQTFLINGPRGERITQLATSSIQLNRKENKIAMLDIEIWTNFGRHYLFGAEGGHRQKRSREMSSQKAIGRQVVNSLIVLVSDPFWSFEDVRIQMIASDEKEVLPNPPPTVRSINLVSQKVLDDGIWMLDGEGACYTTASLKNVRSIRFSTGAEGHSRTKDHITGLYIEYYGGMEDAIVGQWIKEFACMTLERAERLTEVFFSATTEKKLNRSIQHFGKVTGLGVTTSTRRCFDAQPTAPIDNTRVRYRATPYEDLQSITWAYNLSMDDIQVHLEATPALKQGQLLYGHLHPKLHPRDLADGITRSHFSFNTAAESASKDHAKERTEAAMRYHYYRESFFFHEVDQYGHVEPLQRVQVTVDDDGKPIGMEFLYAHGVKICHGTIGETQHSIYMDDEKSLTQLLVYEKERANGNAFQPSKFDRDPVQLDFELKSSDGSTIDVGPTPGVVTFTRSLPLVPSDAGLLVCKTARKRMEYSEFLKYQNGQRVIKAVGIWAITKLKLDRLGSASVYEMVDIGPIYLGVPQ